jgi:hypothetical protein
MTQKISLIAALIAILACGAIFAAPAQAGTCQPVKAKGVGKNIATATKYAQDDLKQTAKSLKDKVTRLRRIAGRLPTATSAKSRRSFARNRLMPEPVWC